MAVALLRLIAVILAVWACCLAARRLRSERGRLIPILITAILINLAAFTFSTQAFDLASARDISAVLPFSAVLAGRLLPGRPALRALAPALLAVAVGYAGIAGYYAGSPRQPIETQAVAAWLSAHHQTDGLGGYWSANLTTVATSDRVRVRAVTSSCHRFIPDVWETKKTWYQPPGRATFLVLGLSQVAGANGTAAQATAQFGPPQRNVRIGTYRVMVWNHDLLPALTSGFAPRVRPQVAPLSGRRRRHGRKLRPGGPLGQRAPAVPGPAPGGLPPAHFPLTSRPIPAGSPAWRAAPGSGRRPSPGGAFAGWAR